MKIDDRVFVRGYVDEIRKDTVIVRNDGGYFGTIPSEVITGELPSAQPDGWLEQNKDKILQAGMEGREIDFRIGGRLFAIREKAQ